MSCQSLTTPSRCGLVALIFFTGRIHADRHRFHLASQSLPSGRVPDGRQRRVPSLSNALFRREGDSPLFSMRGGSTNDFDEYSDGDDETDFDDSMFDLDGADFDTADDAFAEESSFDRALQHWSKTPPVTKAYLTLSITATLIGYFTNKNQFPSYFLLDWKPTLFQLQLWRPFTAFLNFGPLNIGYILTGQFVWTYMSTLERLNHDKPYDFWVMIAFGCASMVAGYSVLKISPKFLGHNLSTFLVYVWSRYHEGLEVNIMELFNTRAEMLPWFFLAQTALLEGQFPVLDLLGILFGHIYHHCKTTNILKTPKIIIDWYHGEGKYSKIVQNMYKEISSEFEVQ